MDFAYLILLLVILFLNLFVVFRFLSKNKEGESLKEETQQVFVNVIERLGRIDEAQKHMSYVGEGLQSLQSILTDKKTRGVFGEVQLKNILVAVLGEKQGSLFDLQKTLSNQKIVDAMVYLPEPIGHLAIDSKFPLENFKRMESDDGDEYRKEFVRNLKKHIDDIADKYIIKGETAPYALMFIPAEAIFASIHAHHEEIIAYGAKRNVWLTSPTTLMATMTTMQALMIHVQQNENMHVIHEELKKLGQDFIRYKKRWDALSKHIKTVEGDVRDVAISSQKIEDRFQKILNLELEDKTSGP